MSKKSFVVLFLNNAFVRVDYFAYSYSVGAKVWGAEENQSGLCYIADLAVLETEKLKPSEIDYLLSQALAVKTAEFSKLNELKIVLVQSAILSRTLENKELSFEELANIADALSKSQEKISMIFERFDSYVNQDTKDLIAAEEQEAAKMRMENDHSAGAISTTLSQS